MKRGDYAALALLVVQAVFLLLQARQMTPDVPSLGDRYFTVPLANLSEALGSILTLGYPLFHAFMAKAGWGLESYPVVQSLVLIPCVLVAWWGLRAYGLPGLAAAVAVSPLLWIVPVERVMPETLAKCFAIATVGFLCWAAGTRRITACIGLSLAVFLACQMRPAFLFLVGFVPCAWFVLYTRRWGVQDQVKWLRQAGRIATACVLPLFLFCLLRLVVVGHFGLVSFGGQNTIGISIEMLSDETVDRLPVRDRPLALVLNRAREAWPEPRYLTDKGLTTDWLSASVQYAANINRIARNMQARFPSGDAGVTNVEQDKALNRMSTAVFRARPEVYGAWLVAAAVESVRGTVSLLLGEGGDQGYGLGTLRSVLLLLLLLALATGSWLVERRAFGEGSRPHYARAVTVVAFVALLFFALNMLLVILVEPPIPRYLQAAAFLLPCAVAAFCWDRAVVLAAGLCRQPYWYGQCLADYPAIPDVPVALPWRAWVSGKRPGRLALAIAVGVVVLLVTSFWWTTRDDRLFAALRKRPAEVRETLLARTAPLTWRDNDGATVLHYAALQGDAPLVQHLLATGSPADTVTRQGATALHWAALGTNGGEVVRALVAAGLAPEAPGPLGLSTLHLAALTGNTATLQALLESGIGPDLPSAGKIVPLHLAHSREVARILLENGAGIDSPDGAGATPFIWAHTRDLAEFLLEQGADINAREDWWSFVRQCTPLHKAAYQGDNETARWLLDHGADPDAGDINNFSPLYYALWRKNEALVALLLDRGADPNHPGRWLTYNRANPSHRYTDIYLKTLGGHPKRHTHKDLVPDGVTLRPLDWAAFLGNPAMIDILLERGADLTLHNDAGMSALHWATLAYRNAVEERLKEHDPDGARLDDPRRPFKEFKAAVRAAK